MDEYIIGICNASPLPNTSTGFTPFVTSSTQKRTNPAAVLPGAKSIIAVGVGYKDNIPQPYKPIPKNAGLIASFAAAEDYHAIIKSLLENIADNLKKHLNFKYKTLIDSPTLDERALAVRAGLGFFGRNGLVVSPEYGTRFGIGLMLTDMEIETLKKIIHPTSEEPPPSIGMACPPGCNKCAAACPTAALSRTGSYDVSRCISYLTQKDHLTQGEMAIMGNHLYGCDICQDACPFNKPQPTAWALPEDWLSMSDDEFKTKYGHTPMMWRGAELLRRNAEIVLRNTTH